MNENGLKSLKKRLAENGKQGQEIRNLPILKGQKLTFIDGEEGLKHNKRAINGTIAEWDAFLTKEGFEVPFSQIARRNNGLMLESTLFNDAIEEFAGRIDGDYSVIVNDVKKVESSFGEGKSTYLLFTDAVYGVGEEEEEEPENEEEEEEEEEAPKPKRKNKK